MVVFPEIEELRDGVEAPPGLVFGFVSEIEKMDDEASPENALLLLVGCFIVALEVLRFLLLFSLVGGRFSLLLFLSLFVLELVEKMLEDGGDGNVVASDLAAVVPCCRDCR